MNVSTGMLGPHANAPSGRRLALGGRMVMLDRGGACAIAWPDAAAMAAQIAALGELASPVVRYAGGVLIADLSLQDNLMLEPALQDGVLPTHLLPEIDALFEGAGCPVDWPGWAATLPPAASPRALMQVRVGRALVADPDLLLLDADAWDDELLPPARLTRAFVTQYPWRMLVWATHDAAREQSLLAFLQEFHA